MLCTTSRDHFLLCDTSYKKSVESRREKATYTYTKWHTVQSIAKRVEREAPDSYK